MALTDKKYLASAEDLSALLWALLMAKHENSNLRMMAQEGSLDAELLRDEYDIFEGAERVIQRIWNHPLTASREVQ